MHHYQDLIKLFDRCFATTYQTRLIKGEDEPLYVPADETCVYNRLYFAHGFFSSALHECAHWLIAGAARRKQVDFGYWYIPDGRNAEEQERFQRAEVKPQAMEWILSAAAQFPFRLSIDNINGGRRQVHAFKQAVYEQVLLYCQTGLPPRATLFRDTLADFYGTDGLFEAAGFTIAACLD